MFAMVRQARLAFAGFQCLAAGPDFVPASQMHENVIFDMGELKTKVFTCARSTDDSTGDVTELCVVSDVHHKILGLRKTIFSAEEAEQQDRLAVQQAVAMDGIRKALTQ